MWGYSLEAWLMYQEPDSYRKVVFPSPEAINCPKIPRSLGLWATHHSIQCWTLYRSYAALRTGLLTAWALYRSYAAHHTGLLTAGPFADLKQEATAAVSSWGQLSCNIQKILPILFFPKLWLLKSFHPLFHDGSWVFSVGMVSLLRLNTLLTLTLWLFTNCKFLH